MTRSGFMLPSRSLLAAAVLALSPGCGDSKGRSLGDTEGETDGTDGDGDGVPDSTRIVGAELLGEVVAVEG